MRPERARIAAGFLVALVCGTTLQHFQFADWADRALIDTEFRFSRWQFPQPVENDVVVVGIDEASFEILREPFTLWHPHLGAFLRAMAVSEPLVVGLDIVLPDRSFHFLIPRYDQPLLQGLAELKAHAPIVLAQSIDEKGNPRPIFSPYLSVIGTDALGSAAICRDKDQIIRRFDEKLCGQPDTYVSLAGKMAQFLGVKQEWAGLINYELGAPINYIPFQQVLDWFKSKNIEALSHAFRGKPVLLGVVLPFADRYPLPVALAAFEPDNYVLPAVIIHAQVLRSMLHGGLIRTAPESKVLLVSALALLAWFGTSSWWKAAGFALGALVMLGASLLMLWKGFFFPAAGIISLALLALLARAAYDAALQIREKRFLRGDRKSVV